MNTPRYPMPCGNRLLDCEEALEKHFHEMVDEAGESGWHDAEIALALTSLADNLILKLMAKEEAVRKLVDLKFKLH